ncbi:hypothetical protein LT330_010769 [Penicillium expansum]|nr:hypothetical protein LT330_010769 [Penicillium expansum]
MPELLAAMFDFGILVLAKVLMKATIYVNRTPVVTRPEKVRLAPVINRPGKVLMNVIRLTPVVTRPEKVQFAPVVSRPGKFDERALARSCCHSTRESPEQMMIRSF